MLITKKTRKLYSAKEIKKKEASDILKIKSDDDPKLIIGLFRKKKLIGVCAAYEIRKKLFKKMYSSVCKIENVFAWKMKLSKKYKENLEIKTLFEMEKYKISRKKFPKVCYSTRL